MKQDKATANAEGQSKGNEYFAETSEAFFNRNNFFLLPRGELKQHDPEMFALLETLWGDHSQTEIPPI
jgi:hypothetical protein